MVLRHSLPPPAEDEIPYQPRVILTERQKQLPVWEMLDEILGPVPEDERDKVPHDGAENHDHYLYGAPKRTG